LWALPSRRKTASSILRHSSPASATAEELCPSLRSRSSSLFYAHRAERGNALCTVQGQFFYESNHQLRVVTHETVHGCWLTPAEQYQVCSFVPRDATARWNSSN